MKVHFLDIECIKKVCCVIEITLNIYKINKLFLVISCFGMWKLMNNMKVWVKRAFYFLALLIVNGGNPICCRAVPA